MERKRMVGIPLQRLADWDPEIEAHLRCTNDGTFKQVLGEVVAAIVGFALVFLLFFFGFLEFLTTASVWREVFAYLNVLRHMEELGKGIVDTRRLVYYASAVVLLLFLSVRALEERKWR